MKLKNYWKRFWTLDRHTSAGFTLVELIVVIAILAILAGVGIPVYSGYIKKANIAADEQLLVAVNTAFAAACLQNGESHTDLDETPTLTLAVGANGGLKVSSVSMYNDAFQTYFAGNENSEFKVYTAFSYVNGAFVGSAEGNATVNVTFNGQTYTINQSSVDDFKAATAFSDNVEELQTQVNSLANSFTDIVSGNMSFLSAFFGEEYADYLADYEDDEIGNATVLYVAQQTAGMTAEDALSVFAEAKNYMLNAEGEYGVIDVLQATSGDKLANAAVMYGAITAYADQPGNEALKAQVMGVDDAGSFLALLQTAGQDEGFTAYIGQMKQDGSNGIEPTDQFTTDMNGFLGAMDVINTVSPDVDTSDEDVWTSDEVNDLLAELLGKN